MFIYASVMFIIYPIGIPMALLVMMSQFRSELHQHGRCAHEYWCWARVKGGTGSFQNIVLHLSFPDPRTHPPIHSPTHHCLPPTTPALSTKTPQSSSVKTTISSTGNQSPRSHASTVLASGGAYLTLMLTLTLTMITTINTTRTPTPAAAATATPTPSLTLAPPTPTLLPGPNSHPQPQPQPQPQGMRSTTCSAAWR